MSDGTTEVPASADATAADAPPAPSSEAPVPAGATAEARLRVRIAGATNVGRIREHNEDNFLIADLTQSTLLLDTATTECTVDERGILFAVCDGMGGAAAGEVASQMAVDVVHGIVQDGEAPKGRDQFAQRLVASVQEAGARIFLAAKSNRDRRGMGTTSTVAGVYGSTLFVGQVGDSRAYLLRNGRLRQITKDQSLVSKLIEAGQLSESEAETYEHAHIILQALGTADTVSVDLSYVELRDGDVVMLCSDGLSGLATFEQIRDSMEEVEDPAACCQRLIDLANDGGGHDNITAIVARFECASDDGAEDDDVGYQPYVLLEPVEAIVAGLASTSIKLPNLPPPGSDLKHSLSMPPDMPSVVRIVRAAAAKPPEDELDAYTRRAIGLEADRRVLGWVLVVLSLAVLGLAGWLLLRPAPAAPGQTVEVEAGAPEPTPLGAATTVDPPAVPAPAEGADAAAPTP